jgi:hypothetical protein
MKEALIKARRAAESYLNCSISEFRILKGGGIMDLLYYIAFAVIIIGAFFFIVRGKRK